MNKLSLTLSCLAIAALQLNQASFAFDPIVGASSKTAISSISDLAKNAFLTSLASNNLNTCTDRNLLTFIGNSGLGLSNLLNNKTNNSEMTVATQGSNINLKMGNILISPKRDIVVNTQEGAISVGAKAVVFIMTSNLGTVIYDLYQGKPEQVSVSLRKQKLIMGPGVMLVLTKQKARTFENLTVNCHKIKYRSAWSIRLEEDSVNAFAAKFSIFSALVKIEPLRVLVDSKDKKDQSLLSMLLKSAVMLRY